MSREGWYTNQVLRPATQALSAPLVLWRVHLCTTSIWISQGRLHHHSTRLCPVLPQVRRFTRKRISWKDKKSANFGHLVLRLAISSKILIVHYNVLFPRPHPHPFFQIPIWLMHTCTRLQELMGSPLLRLVRLHPQLAHPTPPISPHLRRVTRSDKAPLKFSD